MKKKLPKRSIRRWLIFLISAGLLFLPYVGFSFIPALDEQVTKYPVNMPKILKGAIDQQILMYDPIMAELRSTTLDIPYDTRMLSVGFDLNLAQSMTQFIIPMNFNLSKAISFFEETIPEMGLVTGISVPVIRRSIEYDGPNGISDSDVSIGDLLWKLRADYQVIPVLGLGLTYGLKMPSGLQNNVTDNNILLPTGTGSVDSLFILDAELNLAEQGVDLTTTVTVGFRLNWIGTNTVQGTDVEGDLIKVYTRNPDSFNLLCAAKYNIAPLLDMETLNYLDIFVMYHLLHTYDNGYTLSEAEYQSTNEELYDTEDSIQTHDLWVGFNVGLSEAITARIGMSIPLDTYYGTFNEDSIRERYAENDLLFPSGSSLVERSFTGNISVSYGF